MEAGIPRRGGKSRAQRRLSVGVAASHAIEVGEVDRGGSELRRQSQRRLVFGLRCSGLALAGVKAAERHARLRTVGVELLRGDELLRRAVESRGPGRFRRSGKEIYGANSHPADRVAQE